MTITMTKFGTVLNGRPSAREAVLRLHQIINGSADREDVVLDFGGVEVLTPSYADELLRGLSEKYTRSKIKIENGSSAVLEVIETVERKPANS
jgi:hypothetical protein